MLRIYLLLPLFAVFVLAVPARAEQPSCSEAIKKIRESPEMRIHGGAAQVINGRTNALVYLQLAEQAAAAGDEKQCWVHLNRAHVVLIP